MRIVASGVMLNSMFRTASTARREVVVTAGHVELPGLLAIPAGATGTVVFAHGSGSSRESPRNAQVARTLEGARLATLLFDLLTPAEADDRRNVFDIPLLAGRLAAATSRLLADTELGPLPLGYFGASTGAAAALWAAADDPRVRAVVSRGGRPDLARPRLPAVHAPTLLIVGSLDPVVLDLNEEARLFLHCESDLRLVPGATHLFAEPGALEAVAQLARDWFLGHLGG
jgi:pimeloyl-ACP methyl ester carboxylesterase